MPKVLIDKIFTNLVRLPIATIVAFVLGKTLRKVFIIECSQGCLFGLILFAMVFLIVVALLYYFEYWTAVNFATMFFIAFMSSCFVFFVITGSGLLIFSSMFVDPTILQLGGFAIKKVFWSNDELLTIGQHILQQANASRFNIALEPLLSQSNNNAVVFIEALHKRITACRVLANAEESSWFGIFRSWYVKNNNAFTMGGWAIYGVKTVGSVLAMYAANRFVNVVLNSVRATSQSVLPNEQRAIAVEPRTISGGTYNERIQAISYLDQMLRRLDFNLPRFQNVDRHLDELNHRLTRMEQKVTENHEVMLLETRSGFDTANLSVGSLRQYILGWETEMAKEVQAWTDLPSRVGVLERVDW